MYHTPPNSEMSRQYNSDSDIAEKVGRDVTPQRFISTRNKRLRSDDGEPGYLQLFKEEIMNLLVDWKKDSDFTIAGLVKDVSDMRQQMSDMLSQNDKITESVTGIEKSLDFLSKQYDILKEKMEILEYNHKDSTAHIKILEERVEYFERKLDTFEQQSRLTNVEICNVPERRNENLSEMIEALGVAIKHTVTKQDVVSIHRVPHATSSSSHPKNIIVKFTTRSLRDNFLASARLSRGVHSNSLNVSGEPRKIFINEHLTLKNKALFREAREAARKYKFRFVWVKHGNILVRENESSHVIGVRSLSDISKIKAKST